MSKSAATFRFCSYTRVSTGRQAEGDLSLPDQSRQLREWGISRGGTKAGEFADAGETATDDNRPEFQRMIERACDDDKPFDVILVHSYSRFFRDAFGLEMYVRKLAKRGVRLISITQELGDDPAQVMMRQIIALFDEYQSRENAKHVLRAMKENARQGFYNGSPTPRLFDPTRLTALLATLTARRDERTKQVDRRVADLLRKVTDAEDKLKRLYAFVENGTDIDDILRERIDDLRMDRDKAKEALARIAILASANVAVDPIAIERFGRAMRENITSGEVPFRKAFVRAVVDRVEVGDSIVRIVGQKSTLEHAIAGKTMANGSVRSRVPEWRARKDSNL